MPICLRTLVDEGQHVDAQELIALSGASGVADGPHLHFEVRVGQNNYTNTRNPLLWLYPFPEQGTIAGRVTWPSGELLHGAQLFLRRVDAGSKYAETSQLRQPRQTAKWRRRMGRKISPSTMSSPVIMK